MAASIEQKVDYLLKKIGYTASKTGIAEDSSLSGTKKAPFAEALPSPLVVPATSIYGQSESIPATPPGTTSGVVEVYGTATAFQMTEDNTVSGQRAWLARSVQGNNTSPMVGDWIDTQFGSDYIINVYAGDPNAGGTKLSAAGSGSNDTWFFDYASGVLNFNGDAAPTAVTGGADIYLVGYRYTGTKGATGAGGNFTNAVVGVLTVTGTITAQSDIIGDGASNITGFNSITAASYYVQDGSNAPQQVLSVSGTDVSLSGINTIDAVTKETLEASLALSPNEFSDIVVSGLSTFNGDVEFGSNINVAGVATIGTLNVLNPLENVVITDVTITGDALVGGALTVTGGIDGNATSADEVKTIRTNTAAVHYLTFVDGDNTGTPSNEQLNTSLFASINPSDGSLVANKLTATSNFFLGVDEVTSSATELNYLDGSTPGSATANNAVVLDANGDISGLGVVGVSSLNVTGNATVGGDLTVAGTLTYEDVTDIDSIGLITARTGIHVLAGGIDVQAGVVTSADGFEGDLTGNVTGNVVGDLTGEVNAAAFDTNADGTVTTGIATATGFSGPLVGNVTGNVTGNVVGDLTGEVNAAAFDTNADGIVVTGVATATAFVGDGSGLTGLEAGLDGLDVNLGDVTVGGALTVTGATTAADITSSGTVDAATFSVSGTDVLQTVNGQVALTGIATLDATTKATIEREIALAPNDFASLNVTGVGTFGGQLNADGGLDVTGHSELDTLRVSGVSTFQGTSNFDFDTNFNQGTVTIANIGSFDTLQESPLAEFTAEVEFTGGLTVAAGELARIDGDLDVDGLSELDDVNIAGVATGTQFNIGNTAVLETVNGQVSLSGIATLDATTKATIEREIALAPNDFASLNITGLSTFAGLADFNGGIDVTGHSELDTLRVSGVATVTGALDANGGANLSGGVVADNLTIAGFTTVGGDLLANANLDVTDHTTLNTLRATGVSTFVSSVQVDGDLTANGDIIGDGSTDISGIASVTATEFYGDGSNLTGLEAGLDGLNVTLGDVTVGGALTVTGATDINGDIDIDGHAEVDELRVSGVSTFVGGATFEENLAILGQGSIQTLVVGGNSSLQATQVGGGLTVTGATDLNGALDVQGNTNLQANLAVGGTANFSDLVSFQDNVNANGSLTVADDFSVADIFSVVSTGELQEFLVSGVIAEFADGIRVDGTVSGNAGIVTTGDLAGAVTGLDIAPRHINASGIITAAGQVDANGGLDVAGGATLDSASVTGNTVLGTDATNTVTVNADVASDLIPDGNNTRDLGDLSNRWANVYAGEINTTTLDVASNVTIGGNLSVGGTITSAELIELDIIAPVIELGLESVGDGTLQPPSTQTNYSSGTAMWYNRVGVSSDNAQAAAIFADLKPTGTYRIGFATDVTIGDGDVLGAVNGWAEIEAAGLWMNDCAGQSVVINCTGTERFLNNITVDGGTF